MRSKTYWCFRHSIQVPLFALMESRNSIQRFEFRNGILPIWKSSSKLGSGNLTILIFVTISFDPETTPPKRWRLMRPHREQIHSCGLSAPKTTQFCSKPSSVAGMRLTTTRTMIAPLPVIPNLCSWTAGALSGVNTATRQPRPTPTAFYSIREF